MNRETAHEKLFGSLRRLAAERRIRKMLPTRFEGRIFVWRQVLVWGTWLDCIDIDRGYLVEEPDVYRINHEEAAADLLYGKIEDLVKRRVVELEAEDRDAKAVLRDAARLKPELMLLA